MSGKLYVIDGSGFAFRSFFGIRALSDSKGRPTNAVFGFARMLMKILREHDPSHIVVAFDAPGPTFRDDLFAEYKGTRPPTPPDLVSQMPLIEELVRAFEIPVIRKAGVEADDVMGVLARRGEAAGFEVVLVTSDKDILQLVTEKVRVFDPAKGDSGTWYGRDEVFERFGVSPERVIDTLALMGDASDNVPGVRGIGEKTARALLEKYGSLEGVYEHLDEMKGKQRERLEQDRDMAFLSRRLVTIDTQIDPEMALESCVRGVLDRGRLVNLFISLDFNKLVEEFLPDGVDAAAEEKTAYFLVLTPESLQRVIDELRTHEWFAVDTETTSTDPMRAELVGISLSGKPGSAYYVPVGHAPELLSPTMTLTRETALDMLRPLLEDPCIGKVGHNIKYDIIVLERAGVRVAGVTFDTMVASYLTDPSRIRHNLSEVCLHYLKRNMVPISDLIGKGAKAITFDRVPLEAACSYSCEDADITGRLVGLFQPLLRERGLDTLFREIELPLILVLAHVEQAGVAIDLAVFDGLRREVEARLAALESDIFALAGAPFQIGSPKQLQEVLFDRLGLRPVRKTKTGYSTDVEVLEQLALEHPLPSKLLEYRTLEKLRGTYIEALPRLVHPQTGRIHTSFNQAVAATGRLSSSDPNLQNIPVRTELGRRIRTGFIAGDKNSRLISADYSQIELRVLAHLSGDADLKDAFVRDLDIHRDTAAHIFGVVPEEVTPEMRRRAKAVNFGVIYGMSAFGLAKELGISNPEAGRFIDRYFAQYPGVSDWIDATLERARKDGYVTTLLNRRRYVPDLNSGDVNVRKAAERVAINTPVQGSAADIIKRAMVHLDAALEKTGARLLLQVHDELLAEAPACEAERCADMMRTLMEGAATLDVPLKVDVGIGNNWAEIH